MITLQQMARRLDVPVEQVRTWLDRFTPEIPCRADGANRWYPDESLSLLERVRSLLREGRDAAEIAEAVKAEAAGLQLPASVPAQGAGRVPAPRPRPEPHPESEALLAQIEPSVRAFRQALVRELRRTERTIMLTGGVFLVLLGLLLGAFLSVQRMQWAQFRDALVVRHAAQDEAVRSTSPGTTPADVSGRARSVRPSAATPPPRRAPGPAAGSDVEPRPASPSVQPEPPAEAPPSAEPVPAQPDAPASVLPAPDAGARIPAEKPDAAAPAPREEESAVEHTSDGILPRLKSKKKTMWWESD
ncbi:MAG: MerR family transcriptional regulator [Kiritimatiellae bacterium]|nr:MerR family transcriptional regulator [Kiritimatiellia bacterium]